MVQSYNVIILTFVEHTTGPILLNQDNTVNINICYHFLLHCTFQNSISCCFSFYQSRLQKQFLFYDESIHSQNSSIDFYDFSHTTPQIIMRKLKIQLNVIGLIHNSRYVFNIKFANYISRVGRIGYPFSFRVCQCH